MSFHEGSKWQERLEDAKKDLKAPSKEDLLNAKGKITVDFNQLSKDDFDEAKFFKIMKEQGIKIVHPKPSLKEAIEILCNALREDTSEGSYYYSWQANIAMAFQDEFNRQMNEKENFTKYLFTENGVHNISNEASKNFLNLLIK